MPSMSRKNAILLLGDQLSWGHPALQQADPDTTVVILAEVREEASYVRHNRHKIAPVSYTHLTLPTILLV